MATFLKLAIWNANGLLQHRDELKMFLYTYDLDAILISETHFTEKSYIRIPHYTLSHTNHPAGTARGGTAIILKKTPPNITR
jgi:exonuclease III